MTAHELARRLLDGEDLPLTVSGYEGGVDDVKEIVDPRPIHRNVNKAWYYGAHEYHDEPGICSSDNCTGNPTDRAIHLC